jgi:type II secretory pathway pseudopilin PulG
VVTGRASASVRPGVAGFTLVELVIAAILGLFVVVMALSVLQVQGQLQTRISESVGRQNVLDFAASVVTDELRPVTGGGLIYADADSIAFRRPLVIGQFCAVVGSSSYLYFPLDGQTLPTSQVAGIAVREADNSWQYFDLTWAQMAITFTTTGAAACANVGADTAKIRTEFGMVGTQVPVGTIFNLYQVRNISITTSSLDSSMLGLFVGGTGETTREMAGGLLTGSGFTYRHSDGRLLTAPTTAELASIEAVRFTGLSSSSGRPDALSDSWVVEIRLRNATGT